jgi:hypothetical protein
MPASAAAPEPQTDDESSVPPPVAAAASSRLDVPRIALPTLEENGPALAAALQQHSFVILRDLPAEDIETVGPHAIYPSLWLSLCLSVLCVRLTRRWRSGRRSSVS